MKKLLIITFLLLIGIVSFSQELAAPAQFSNGESMGSVRTKVNGNFVAHRNFINNLYDTSLVHNTRIKALDARVVLAEDAIAGGLGGGGTTYVIGNGLTLTGGSTINFGGSLSAATNITTGAFAYSMTSLFGAYPANSNYYSYSLSRDNGSNTEHSTYTNSVKTSYSSYSFTPDGLFSIKGSTNPSSQLAKFETDGSSAIISNIGITGGGVITVNQGTTTILANGMSIGNNTYTFGRTLTTSIDNQSYLTDLSYTTKGYLDKRPVTVQLMLTDTIDSNGDDTGYILAISDALAGKNLTKVEAYFLTSQGTAVPVINVHKIRASTTSTMTSNGANFTVNATVNPSYDDVAKGDRIKIIWTLGTGTPPYGISTVLTFEKP